MGPFDRTFFLIVLLTLVICFAIADLGLEVIKQWQTLIAGLLALAGAGLVLIAADRQIAHGREVAEEAREIARRAALMDVFLEMEVLLERCETVAVETRNWVNSKGDMGHRHTSLPVPDLARSAAIARLPEAEDLFKFLRNLRVVNDNASIYGQLQSSSDLPEYVMAKAAATAIRAYAWRTRLAASLGWTPKRYHQDRLDYLRQLAAQGPDGEGPNDLPPTD